jgi:hypothetical protein
MALLRTGGWNVPVSNLDRASNKVIQYCENIAAQTRVKFLEEPGEWAMIGSILEEDEIQTLSDMRFGTGRRIITSGGDTCTRDINLEVFGDWKGYPILGSDYDSDARPIVECNSSYNMRYGIHIINARSEGATLILTAILSAY